MMDLVQSFEPNFLSRMRADNKRVLFLEFQSEDSLIKVLNKRSIENPISKSGYYTADDAVRIFESKYHSCILVDPKASIFVIGVKGAGVLACMGRRF